MTTVYQIDKKSMEIEVNERVAAFLAKSDREIKNNNRRETRRHVLFSAAGGKYEKRFDIVDPTADIESAYIEHENYSELAGFIQTLPPTYRKLATVLGYGKTPKEITQYFGFGEAAVYKTRERLRARIKSFLEQSV